MLTNREAFSNVIWRLLERFGAQTVTFVVSLILARLLNAEIYGTVALIMVFITILQVFVDSGLGSALIQKKDADELDFSTVFFFNIFVCTIIYCFLFLVSPLISRFYKNPELTPCIRVLGLILIISGVKNVQQAYVSKNLIFKKFFFSTLGGTLGAAVFGVWLAYKGCGVWALVGQYLFNNMVDTLILWITVDWKPKFQFSFSRLKGLFSYGWKLLVSTLLEVSINDINSLVIGKVYTPSSLGFYQNGQKIPTWVMSNITSSIDSVLFPSMAAEQDNKERLKVMTSRSIKTSTFAIMPMMMGLAVCAEPLIRVLLTEKWIQSVFFLRIFCLVYSFYPVHTANLNVIRALGRSDLFLKFEVLKKICGFIILLSTMFISVEVMAWGSVASCILSQIINSWYSDKLINYAYKNQLKDMLPNILLSCLMGIIVFPISLIGLNDYIILAIQIPVGVTIYLLGSKLWKIDSFEYIIAVVKGYLPNNKEEK